MSMIILVLSLELIVPVEQVEVTVNAIEINDCEIIPHPQVIFWGWDREVDGAYSVIVYGCIMERAELLPDVREENGWFIFEMMRTRVGRPVWFRVKAKEVVYSTTYRDPEADARTMGVQFIDIVPW